VSAGADLQLALLSNGFVIRLPPNPGGMSCFVAPEFIPETIEKRQPWSSVGTIYVYCVVCCDISLNQ